MIALAGVFEHRILAGIADLLDDFLGRELGFGDIVRGDIGGTI